MASGAAMTCLLSMLAQEAKVRIYLVELPLGRGRGTSPGSALAGDGRPAKWKNDRL
jgi:pantoate kinase